MARDDAHALAITRTPVVSNLGDNQTAASPAPSAPSYDEPHYPIEELYGLVGTSLKRPYDARELIARLVDGSVFDEFKALFGTTLVTGFSRIEGMQVGILANNGVLHSDSAQKGPTSSSSATSGDPAAVSAKHHRLYGGEYGGERGIAKHGAKLVTAVACSRVPKITPDRRRQLRCRQLRHVRARL